VPLKATVMVALVEALEVTVSCPVAAPAAVGSKVRVRESDLPGFKVAGRLTADAEKPLPVMAIEFTVTAALPLEESVTVWVVELLTTTPPNEMLVALAVSAAVAALSCRARVLAVLAVVAVRVADWELLTEATLAVKAALVAAAGTVTAAGTDTALSLLARLTLTPPVGAEPDRLTVHASASEPVMEVLLQETALTVGATVVPVPLRLTEAAGALLAMVNCPVDALAAVGSN
jgi:hypothetical protein